MPHLTDWGTGLLTGPRPRGAMPPVAARLFSGVAVGVAALVLAALPGEAPAATLTFDNPPRLGTVVLGQAHPRLPGFVSSTVGPGDGEPGCVFGPPTIVRFENYRSGIRLGFYGTSRFIGDIAVSGVGARVAGGFVVGRTTFAQVRGRLRGEKVTSVGFIPAQFRLGARALGASRRTGYETYHSYMWWFDAGGVLSGAEAYEGGC